MMRGLLTRRPWRRHRAALAAGIMLLTLACALVGRLRFVEPVVTVRGVTLTGLSVTGGTLEVELSVYNPNRFTLEAIRLTYEVDVDAVRLGTGVFDRPMRVAGRDSSVVRLPVTVTYRGLGAAARGLLAGGEVAYRVRGDCTAGTPLGNFTSGYDRSGRFTAAGRR